MTDVMKIDRSLIIAIADAVLDVAISAVPFPASLGLRILKGIIRRYIDNIVAEVAARFAIPEGSTGAMPVEWKELTLAVLDAVIKIAEGLPVVHKVALALREAVAGPFFDLVYDLLVSRGQAAPLTSALTADITALAEANVALVRACEAACAA